MGLNNDEMLSLINKGVVKRYTGVVIEGLSYDNDDGYAIQNIIIKDNDVKIVILDDLGKYRGYSPNKILRIDEMDARKVYEAYKSETKRGRPKKV